MIEKDTKILIIDDEIDICDQLSGLLSDIGYECQFATSSEEGMELFKKSNFSLVLLDIWLNNSKFDGFQALEKIQSIENNIPVIMISGHGNIETAVNSIKKGAYDFIEKPFDSDLLIFKIKKALENLVLKKKIENFVNKISNSEFVANSKTTKALEKKINQISKTDSNILILGDEGSGREFVAAKIHSLSYRSKKNFKCVDCRKNQDQLDTDLFGYEDKQIVKSFGILDEINNGTLYLKNIDSLSRKLQGKILRILDEKKYYRIGGSNSNNLNIRVISSSIMNKKKTLREDLLNLLNFTKIEVPHLHERKEDIEQLVSIFSANISLKKGVPNKKFSDEALFYLYNLKILKNISQLKKFIEWIIVMMDDNKNEISKNDLHELGINLLQDNSKNSEDSMNLKIKEARDEFEKNYLMYNLEKFEYNVSKMSVEIGMERTALYRKLKSLNINMEI